MFLYDQWAPLPTPEDVKEARKNYKRLSEYAHVKDMDAPVIVRKEKSVPLGPPTTGTFIGYLVKPVVKTLENMYKNTRSKLENQ